LRFVEVVSQEAVLIPESRRSRRTGLGRKGEFAGDLHLWGHRRPKPDLTVPEVAAPKAAFDLDGDGCPVNFDKHPENLPT